MKLDSGKQKEEIKFFNRNPVCGNKRGTSVKTRYDYDLIAVGGGAAGITAVKLAAGLRKKAVLIDKSKFGGECTWTGCIPSKAILNIARAAHTTRNLAEYGISLSKGSKLGFSGVMQSVRKIVNDVYNGTTREYFEKMGIAAFEDSQAVFVDHHTIQVNGKNITSRAFIITTGSRPAIPQIEGLKDIKYYTNDTIFSLPKVPGSMTVLGGGPIGIELASAFNRLGTKVVVLEMAHSILPREDRECADLMADILRDEGVQIINSARVVKIEGKRRNSVIYEDHGNSKTITADLVLLAAGRQSNTDNLGLEDMGVQYDKAGIKVDRRLRTSVNNIYAAGDVVGPYQFSHIAYYQAVLAVTNIFLPVKRSINYDNAIWCFFTDPEMSRSGYTETEAREKYGNRIRVYRVDYSSIDRSKTDRIKTGLAKFILNRRGKLLGIHILGERAGEIIHEVHCAKSLGIPLYKLNSVFHAYPTYSEIIRLAARSAYIDRISNNIAVKLIGKLPKFK